MRRIGDCPSRRDRRNAGISSGERRFSRLNGRSMITSRFRRAAALALLLTAALTARSLAAEPPASRRVEDLIARMTVEEKVGQLTLLSSDRAVTGPYTSPVVTDLLSKGELGGLFNIYDVAFTRQLQEIAVRRTRLGIPLLFGFDVLHGHRTIFPIPLGQAASFDLDAIRGAERIAATETAAAGVNWVYAPMIDVTRDPRWGRIAEGAGESPWLGAKIAAARVAGLQGNDLAAPDSVAACAKHFGANGAVEAGRDYTATDISERALRDIYLPPFKAAVAAGLRCVMASFNTYDGVPGIANRHLLTDILRGEWDFPGVVVSDFGAIEELTTHGVAADRAAAATRALTAGADIEMQGSAFRELPQLIAQGKVPVAALDAAVRRVLSLKEALGLFDDPFARLDEERERAALTDPAHRQVALDLAEKSLVLLKNDGDLLPFSRDLRRIAVIGPLGDDKADMLGPWPGTGKPEEAVTVAEGLRQVLPQASVDVVPAGTVTATSASEREAAVEAARSADVVVLALGEKGTMSGEAASRTELGLPGDQLALARAVLAVGKPTAVVLFHGRPLVLTDLAGSAPAILAAWFPGTMGGLAIARTLVGENEPRGRLPVSFPRAVGQIPIHHDHLPTGRPPTNPPRPYTASYLDEPTSPLFPFGYGLSYTHFSFAAPRLATTALPHGSELPVSVDVTNTGKRRGTALVELYVNQPVAEVSRPVAELRGFQHVVLEPGETKTATLTISADDLAYWHGEGGAKADPGKFRVMTGPDAEHLQAVDFTYEGLGSQP
jgi:beta-glucosidase